MYNVKRKVGMTMSLSPVELYAQLIKQIALDDQLSNYPLLETGEVKKVTVHKKSRPMGV